jgi:hypothetical protein
MSWRKKYKFNPSTRFIMRNYPMTQGGLLVRNENALVSFFLYGSR